VHILWSENLEGRDLSGVTNKWIILNWILEGVRVGTRLNRLRIQYTDRFFVNTVVNLWLTSL